MTQNQCRKKTRKCINSAVKHMRENLERVFLSRCINLDNYDDDYKLQKTILMALLKEEMNQLKPFGKQECRKMEKEANNIYLFI